MWNIIKEYRHYLASVLLATIPLLVLNASGKNPANFHWFDRAAVAVSAPVQSAIAWSIDSSWGLIERYFLLLNVRQNNAELSQANRKLLNELSTYQEMVRENERLRKLVSFEQSLPGKRVVAWVIAQDVSSEFHILRINKGQSSGVEAGMAVVTPEGIVGRVLRVTSVYADVLTLLDSSSAVDALVQRSRARGVVEGLAENTLSLKYLRRTDDVNVGDTVVSSGVGGLYPKGLVIGQVESVKRKNYGITQAVELKPAVDFSKLEEVVVVEPVYVPLTENLPGEEVTTTPTVVATPEKKKAASVAKPAAPVKSVANPPAVVAPVASPTPTPPAVEPSKVPATPPGSGNG